MILDGVSFQGSYHDINQDAFSIIEKDSILAAVVSDGLGSLKKSQIGSMYICQSVEEYINNNTLDMLYENSAIDWITNIHKIWKEKVGNDIQQCYATFLLTLLIKDKLLCLRLGDGFISLLFKEEYKILYDKKEEYYINETDCFYEDLNLEKIEVFEAKSDELICFLVSTDGFRIGNMSEEIIMEFTSDFENGNKNIDKETLKKDISNWFSKWEGTDDKTLVYYLKED